MPEQTTAPQPENRPKFWRYFRERGLNRAQAGEPFGRSDEWVRLITLPFDDPKRRVPSQEDIAAIHRWSSGEITPADWYPPELSAAVEVSDEERAA